MGFRDRIASIYNNVAAEFNAFYGSPGQVDYGEYQRAVRSQSQQGLPLDQNVSVTLDGSGFGQTSLGPTLPREHWQPTSAYVSVATNVNEASCKISVGSTPTSGTTIGQTSKGSSGATCSLSGDMPTGYKIWATWVGGDAGAQATLHVTGTRSIGAP